ncbi:MAG: hypothetical protein V4539_15055 [Bacteroidota bacterium]
MTVYWLCEQDAKGLQVFVLSHSLLLLEQDLSAGFFVFWQVFAQHPSFTGSGSTLTIAWHSISSGCAIRNSISKESM